MLESKGFDSSEKYKKALSDFIFVNCNNKLNTFG